MQDVAATVLRHQLEKIRSSVSVDRFLSGYGNVRTKAAYAGRLAAYFGWLKDAKGVTMGPCLNSKESPC